MFKSSISWYINIGFGFSNDEGLYYSHAFPSGNDLAFAYGMAFGFLP
jgi:hypothetical protein